MKRILHAALSVALGAGITVSFVPPSISAAATCEEAVARVVSVQGAVLSQGVGETQWRQVSLNDTFCPGDKLAAQARSRADVLLINESVLRVNENTSITLEDVKKDGTSVVDVLKGATHFFSRRPRSLDVRTPFAIAGVRGTEFLLRVEEKSTFMSVFEGEIMASNAAGSVALTSGQSAVAEEGKAPVLRVLARPRDAVQWALYYPPVIYVAPGQAPPKEDLNDPRYLAHRASRELAVGRVAEANADIERSLALKPNYSDAYSLQSIIAVVQNDKDKALDLARRAVEADPNSAAARVAMSYAQQARFDLEGARASLEEAVRVEPNNALAWARLAEIQSSFGELDKSLKSARKAVELDPGVARTQTVLGFAYLMQVNTKEARAAFERAIELDQADYLPRLGMGLAKIRDGDLREGGQEIEIAASLDPNNSLVRSYLGKVYYEEKRGNLDEREYAIAKELDPMDPTPWFYDAIAKQTTNRPVEALHDLQKAIELNDNRAVYRSKLLLDSDQAARSASLARIYSDLGFQQLALVEGWKSVNTDPSNYSAHRFLADSYAARPRHEIARVSELLQSQLLQPSNITPIQPRLAESNLSLISAGGAADLSFNEFNPLFNRDRFAFEGSGIAGNNDTWAGEGIVSGIFKKLSFSAGYSYFDTDGWGENTDQKDRIANIFAQWEATPNTSIQGEYRYRDNETGDVRLKFFEDNTNPINRYEKETKGVRFGLRHSFSPNSILVGNFQYLEGKEDIDELFFFDAEEFGLPPPPVEDFMKQTVDEDAYSGELSYLFRAQYVDIVGGAGVFKIDQDIDFTDTLSWPGMDPPLIFGTFENRAKLEIEHYNLYVYSYIKPLNTLVLTLGASADFYDKDDRDFDELDVKKDQFNPKFGIVWNPVPNTTLRGAVFRTFKRTMITDQTLEPTQVAGFNQFFDDGNETKAWVYAGAIDRKFSQNLYGGVEFSYRDLDVPYWTFSDEGALVAEEAGWDELLGRVYLYWTPHKWLGLRAEYEYEKFEYEEIANPRAKEIRTHSVPLGINFFHPSGVFAGLKATYYNQKGDFERSATATFESGDDNFWLVDAGVGFRLPKRRGFITLGVKNLFDKSFEYFEVDFKNSRIQPDRQIFARLTLAFP
jgi:tetratricopeptide (TPR) repeat protein